MTTAAIELLRPSGRRTPCKGQSACRGWRRVTFVKYFSLSHITMKSWKRCVLALSQVHWHGCLSCFTNQAITGCTSNTVASASSALERSTVSEPRLLARSWHPSNTKLLSTASTPTSPAAEGGVKARDNGWQAVQARLARAGRGQCLDLQQLHGRRGLAGHAQRERIRV